jgi:hypothetical protein
MNEVADLIGELSVGVSFAGEVSVGPGCGARAIRIRAALRAMWPAEFLDGGKVGYFGKAEGEREGRLSEGLPRLGAGAPQCMVPRLQRRMDILPPPGSARRSL